MKIALFITSEHFGSAEKVFVELVNAMAEKHDVAAGRLDKIKGFAELIRQVVVLSVPVRLKIIGEGAGASRL